MRARGSPDVHSGVRKTEAEGEHAMWRLGDLVQVGTALRGARTIKILQLQLMLNMSEQLLLQLIFFAV